MTNIVPEKNAINTINNEIIKISFDIIDTLVYKFAEIEYNIDFVDKIMIIGN